MKRFSLVAIMIVAACSTERADLTVLPTVADSAGVRISTYASLADWTDGPSVTEVLRIGSVDGAEQQLFSRLAGGFILSDGGVVLADAESREVRRFGPSGEFVSAHGREGEGPGEYQFIIGMGKCSSAGFTVFDIGWTMSFYDEEGEFIEEKVTRLESGSTPYHMACDRSGRLAAINWDLAGPQLGFHTAMGRLRLLDSGGGELVDLGERIGSERFGRPSGSGPHPAGRATRFGFLGQDLVVADGSFFGFERFDVNGNLKELVQIEAAPPSVDSLMGAYLEWSLNRATSDEQRVAWRTEVERMEGPPQATYFSDIFVSDGIILLREPTVGESGRWFAFQSTGRPEGYLPLPGGSKLLDMRGDYVLVQATGDFDVPVAVLYRVDWAAVT